MATRKPAPKMPFGKESAREERAEKKLTPKQYAAVERREGEKPMKSGKKARC